MPKKRIGPKGQVFISKTIREDLGCRPGADVQIGARGDEVLITRLKIGGYPDYYITTRSKKLSEPLDVKKIILEEALV